MFLNTVKTEVFFKILQSTTKKKGPQFIKVKCINLHSLVGWRCRIHWLHFSRGVRSSDNERPEKDIKQSDGEAPVMLELSVMRSFPSLPSLPGRLWLGMVVW